jgi:dTDP-4-amino-4,6-dideoxygalactose transaminase
MNPIFKYTGERLRTAEVLNDMALNLPLHPRMTGEEVIRVIDLVTKFGKKHGL